MPAERPEYRVVFEQIGASLKPRDVIHGDDVQFWPVLILGPGPQNRTTDPAKSIDRDPQLFHSMLRNENGGGQDAAAA
jgi:hypothetical protein